MAIGSFINQLVAITGMNLRNLPARLGTSLVAVIGIGGVVAVLVSLLSMGEGFRAALELSGRDDVALILRGGSSDELSSSFDREQVDVITSGRGILNDARGAVASPEFYTIVDLPMRSTGTAANVPFRGVTGRAVEVRDGFRMVAGRMFETGKDEVIVGRGAFAQFGNIDLGREVTWGSHVWRVVGVFEAGGSVSESEVWTDLTVLQGV
jgi:putative ABC transport system permease protein